jgi:hypothetical protein
MKKVNLDLKTLLPKLILLLKRMRGALPFMFVVVLLIIYSLLVFRINSLIRSEPSQGAIDAKLQTIKRPKIDQSVVDKIQQLEDNSAPVQSLFQQARDNPFHE